MKLFAIQSHSIWQPFRLVASCLSHLISFSVDTEVDEQENRDRRHFVMEMMDAHPEAFQHEIDCQTMMKFYPSRL